MLRRIVICLIAIFIETAAADAGPRHHIDATPFSHAPCSVLDGRPCTPTFCSVFNHGPCIPEIDYPYGENLQLTVETVFTVGTAYALKNIVRERRPDGSDFQSFPSDTTALAASSSSYLWGRYGWQYGLPAFAATQLLRSAPRGKIVHLLAELRPVDCDLHREADDVAGYPIKRKSRCEVP